MKTGMQIYNRIIFVTGAAGFIGGDLIAKLLDLYSPVTIIGVDSLNNYYDVSIKKWRLKRLDKIAKNHPDST